MDFTAPDLILAWLLDAAIGDPRGLPWPHPVVVVGRVADSLSAKLNSSEEGAASLVARGAVFWSVIVGGTLAAGWALLSVTAAIHPLLGRAAGIYVAYACLATRCLDAEARAVARSLDRGRLIEARERLSSIVGRDTETLSNTEVVRATVETVAENASDGVVAPLLYLGLGGVLGAGPLLGLAYKAVNTLDSMVGYRDERYEYFGKPSAILDDLANWVPARLTALLTAAAAWALWRRGGPSLGTALRDGHLHKSPNSGYPEAAFAGALGVALGGTNTYRGVPRPSPKIGDAGEPLRVEHVHRSLTLLWWISAACLALTAGGLALI